MELGVNVEEDMEITKMEKFVEDNLNCPVCYKPPENEIFQCKNGHPVCGDCIKEVPHCPLCRVPWGTEIIRNRCMEHLLKTLGVDCLYKSEGCSAAVLQNNYANHVKFCSFRPANFCKAVGFDECPFMTSRPSRIFQHLIEQHNVEQCYGPNLDIQLKVLKPDDANQKAFFIKIWKPRLPKQLEKMFLVIGMTNPEREEISFGCLNIDEAITNQQYHLNFEVSDNFEDNKNWKWTLDPTTLNGIHVGTLAEKLIFRIPWSLKSKLLHLRSVFLVAGSPQPSILPHNKEVQLQQILTFLILIWKGISILVNGIMTMYLLYYTGYYFAFILKPSVLFYGYYYVLRVANFRLDGNRNWPSVWRHFKYTTFFWVTIIGTIIQLFYSGSVAKLVLCVSLYCVVYDVVHKVQI